jgi:TolB-like protein
LKEKPNMKKIALTVALLLVWGSVSPGTYAQGSLGQRVSELSGQIAGKMSAKQKTTIAVAEFTDLQGNVTDFGRFLAEELITRLYETEKFKVIERQLLNKVITEQKLSLTGMIDPASAKQLGKLLGVDAIVSGTITTLAQNLKVNARLISTETGEIFAVASTEIFKDESVTGLLSGGSSAPAQAAKQTPQQPSPAKQSPNKINVRDFILELEACRMSAGGVVCSLKITNDAPNDRTVHVYAAGYGPTSRMFDEFGGEYLVKNTRLGSYLVESYNRVGNSLVPQVPMKLRITFDNVNPEAKSATLLRVAFQWSDSNGINLHADFRNVPITK